MSNISRRAFLKGAGVAALAVAAAGVLAGCSADDKVKPVKINYYSEEEAKQIHEETLLVGIADTYVNTSAFKEVPAGYELVLTGDLTINDGYVYAPVRKLAEEKKTVYVTFWDGVKEIDLPNVKKEYEVAADATTFDTSLIKMGTSGWKPVNPTEPINGATVTVKVEQA